MPGKDVKVDAVLSTEGGIRINYLAIVTRWKALFIKVSGQMCSDEFKRRLGFSFTVKILA